jgi:predicted ribosome quality control (RQC) complex YloA/Tae2 family protein
MNSYYALIYLNNALKATLLDDQFVTALTQQKNVLELFFGSNGHEKKVVISTDPQRIACFTDSRINVRQSNVATFFEALEGQKLTNVSLAEHDRILTLHFSGEFNLIIQLYGPKPNVLLSKNGKIIDAFKHAESLVGSPIPEPRSPQFVSFEETSGALKRRIFSAYPFLQRSMVPDLIHYGKLDQKPDAEIQHFLDEVNTSTKTNPEFRRLVDGRFCIIPSRFIPDAEAEEFDSIDDALRVCFYKQRSGENLIVRKQSILSRFQKEETRLNNLIEAGQQSLKSLERAEQYEKFGNILMANAHQKSEWDDTVELEDFYDNNNPIKISVKPDLSLAENAAFYFEKKRKAERSFESLQIQANKSEQALQELTVLKNLLESIEDPAQMRKFLKEHAQHKLIIQTDDQSNQQKRPYLVTHFNSYEIWIGKNAKSNDLMLRDAHKDDVWLHARGVSGSHVIIRMNRKTHDPDSSCLEMAASWAAWKSKAKGSELVPVIWTRKKFVRKPKGAASGAVLVDQEKVIIVEPTEPKNDYFI